VLEVIRAASLLQRHLTSDGDQNFGDYLQELVKCWRPLFEVQSIRIETDTEPVELGSDISSSLALIVQELLTNSAKHAFNDAGGVVRIELNCRGSEAELTVTDNGQGMRQQTLCSPGLGMTIVRQLSERIGATIKIDSHASGTVARLRFPIGDAVKKASKIDLTLKRQLASRASIAEGQLTLGLEVNERASKAHHAVPSAFNSCLPEKRVNLLERLPIPAAHAEPGDRGYASCPSADFRQTAP
jgi:Histidine kinase-, DNA gyrase B-, and HSP90-like ATPase